jgi:hypothetical protein
MKKDQCLISSSFTPLPLLAVHFLPELGRRPVVDDFHNILQVGMLGAGTRRIPE